MLSHRFSATGFCHKLLALPVVLIFGLGLSSCVSVDTILAPSPPKKAEGLNFNEPSFDFKSIKNNTVDRAWQDSKNGNTIAFLSECNAKTDPSLKEMENENLAAMTNVNITENRDTTYNEREALFSSVNGQVDGVEVRMRLVLFKKDNCNYTLSYVGRKKHFPSDEKIFNDFVEGFKAP